MREWPRWRFQCFLRVCKGETFFFQNPWLVVLFRAVSQSLLCLDPKPVSTVVDTAQVPSSTQSIHNHFNPKWPLFWVRADPNLYRGWHCSPLPAGFGAGRSWVWVCSVLKALIKQQAPHARPPCADTATSASLELTWISGRDWHHYRFSRLQHRSKELLFPRGHLHTRGRTETTSEPRLLAGLWGSHRLTELTVQDQTETKHSRWSTNLPWADTATANGMMRTHGHRCPALSPVPHQTLPARAGKLPAWTTRICMRPCFNLHFHRNLTVYSSSHKNRI